MVEMMASNDGEIQKILSNLKMISSARQSTEAFNKAYVWLAEESERYHPDEAIATLAFAQHGQVSVDHLRWSDLVNLNRLFKELCQWEQMLSDQVNKFREQCGHRDTSAVKVNLGKLT